MNNLKTWLLAIACSALFCLPCFAEADTGLAQVRFDQLPVSAQKTLGLIKQNGPFPFDKDGVVFGNYEGILPKQKRGYYHEYTVPTAGAKNRGAQRIVMGGTLQNSPDFYYTNDHYASFKRIQE
ncbi:ribonuclease [Solimicrobium silvestre]|nr:ribonuclease [Solimicrobium silvestre]